MLKLLTNLYRRVNNQQPRWELVVLLKKTTKWRYIKDFFQSPSSMRHLAFNVIHKQYLISLQQQSSLPHYMNDKAQVNVLRQFLQRLSWYISDIDECSASQPVCHASAQCVNTLGSFQCICQVGFTGGLTICTGKPGPFSEFKGGGVFCV